MCLIVNVLRCLCDMPGSVDAALERSRPVAAPASTDPNHPKTKATLPPSLVTQPVYSDSFSSPPTSLLTSSKMDATVDKACEYLLCFRQVGSG